MLDLYESVSTRYPAQSKDVLKAKASTAILAEKLLWITCCA